MPYVTVGKENGANFDIYYKDWGKGQPIVFSHGLPLSADDWDTQMLFFLNHGYRAIAHDRRGHGRPTQTSDGHDMDHYADDRAALSAHLDLKDAVHVGHSTGGGEVAQYLGRHGESRVAKAALISAVPPLMMKTEKNPAAFPKKCSMDCRRSSRPIARNSTATCRKAILWLQPSGCESLAGDHPELVAAKHDGRREGALRWHRRLLADRFHRRPEKDHRPVLVMHGDDDQIVPYADAGPLSAKLLKNGTLKTKGASVSRRQTSTTLLSPIPTKLSLSTSPR
jgi:non-heme chloroperoxidase